MLEDIRKTNYYSAQNDIDYLLSLIDKYKEALEFYADEKNHDWYVGDYDENPTQSIVMEDKGKLARDILDKE